MATISELLFKCVTSVDKIAGGITYQSFVNDSVTAEEIVQKMDDLDTARRYTHHVLFYTKALEILFFNKQKNCYIDIILTNEGTKKMSGVSIAEEKKVKKVLSKVSLSLINEKWDGKQLKI